VDQTMRYLDFEMRVEEGSQGYTVIVDSPVGEARESVPFPFGELELKGHLQSLEIALLRSGGTRRSVPGENEQTVQEFGASLYRFLFPDRVHSLFLSALREAGQKDQGVRIKLRFTTPELASLPWEFLYDDSQGQYICLSTQTPVVRYLERGQSSPPLAVKPPLRILGMIAAPTGLGKLNVQVEKQRVDNALAPLSAAGLVEMRWLEGQTWRSLMAAMNRGPWHIFHFIGHGGFDAQQDEGLIAFCDDQGNPHMLTATQLGLLLADHRPLRLALLNACEGATGGTRDIYSSTASILMRRGVPAVIAMQYEITDTAAIEFTTTFYASLADNLPVDAAVTQARKAINLGVHNSVEWGTPVLHMRSDDGQLFTVDKTDAVTPIQKPIPQVVPVAAGPALVTEAPQVSPRPEQFPPVMPAKQPNLKRYAIYAGIVVLALAVIYLFSAYSNSRSANSAAATAEANAAAAQAVLADASRGTATAEAQTAATVSAGVTSTAEVLAVATEEARTSATAQAQTTSTALAQATSTALALRPPTGSTNPWANPKDGAVYVYVAPGPFTMGWNQGANNEKPEHSINLDGYWIMKYEVTNEQFSLCLNEGGCHEAPDNNRWNLSAYAKHPVTNVNWQQAVDYASWANGRLPSEAEWEKACRGVGGIYPWGNFAPTNSLANYNKTINDVVPVGTYADGASPYGAMDMIGNVWEWTNSLYVEAYPYNANDGRESKKVAGSRVLRGGSFVDIPANLRCTYRARHAPDEGMLDYGIRVLIPAP
jgi:formylglycine-generating enzyme required for sulfatase activity